MNEKEFVELLSSDMHAPSAVEILQVRQYSIEDNIRRLKRLIDTTGEVCQRSLDRADYVHDDHRTVARLPQGARGEVFHTSGALRVMTGLAPMEALFDRLEPREGLIKMVSEIATQLRIAEWVGESETLEFERLWQIKAAAADQKREQTRPVLCRAVGAYRQSVGRLPVLGGASVAIKLAGGGLVDSVTVQLLEPAREPIESAPLITPDLAARQVFQQLESLMGRSGVSVAELETSVRPLQLGYLHLGKRKTQHVLAPHYVAAIRINGEEAQAYQLVVSATQKTFQPLCLAGRQGPVRAIRRAS